MVFQEPLRFDGPAYDPKNDQARLSGQVKRIFELMKDGKWRTLDEIFLQTSDPQASISAQLRHLRKERFGAHIVSRRHHGNLKSGLYEYKLIVNIKGGAIVRKNI